MIDYDYGIISQFYNLNDFMAYTSKIDNLLVVN
jgi:hypothetical protein